MNYENMTEGEKLKLIIRVGKKRRAKRKRKRLSARRRQMRVTPFKKRLLSGLFIALFLCVLLLIPTFVAVKKVVLVEAGERCPDISAFLNFYTRHAYFTDPSTEDRIFDLPGEYEVGIRVLFFDTVSKVEVSDRTAPKVITKDVSVERGTKVLPEMFVESIEDYSATDISFRDFGADGPDTSEPGEQEVVLKAVDACGNVTEFTGRLIVTSDKVPPRIEGVSDITVNFGEGISYKKGITVIDDEDPEPVLSVDNSKVDTSKPGTYEVTYIATDKAGNTATATATVTIVLKEPETITMDYVNVKADEVLATIIKDGMTEKEKAYAIFRWTHDNIGYYDNTPKVDETDGAYRGIVQRKGDCYTYAMTSKCLLTRAGIKNQDIGTIPNNPHLHFWNLVYIDGAWRHFDATRRADKSEFFLTPDAEVYEYSESHDGTHRYNPSLYPKIA